MPSTFAVVVTAVLVIYGGLHLILNYTQDAREPPAVSTAFPFLGPMIDMSRKKTKFYVEMRNKYKLPIYTVRLPGARLYVINSASLISSVQRQFKTLAFPPIECDFATKVCGTSKRTNEILNTNVNGDEGDWGYSMTFYKSIHTPLAPGPQLDAMNRAMARKISASMEGLKGERIVKLFEFVKHEIAVATTASVYGPKNPFNDPMVEESFWKFQPGVLALVMGIMPSIIAKESVAAREYMVKAFTKYLQANGHLEGSGLIQSRFNHSREHDVGIEDIARFEVGNTIGLLTNTAPTAFWLLYHLYSNPVALKDCREELSKLVSEETVTEDGNPIKVRTIDISHVKLDCPIMLSALKEALRTHSVAMSIRKVMEDHLLDNKYLLKKGNTVMIPAPVQHTDLSAWGSDVKIFDHRRFPSKSKVSNPLAFRGFGGGTTLCPGRHFASTEILAFAALMMLRFDVEPMDGKWTPLTSDNAELWESTAGPDGDIDVKISLRSTEDANTKWRILVTDSDKAMPLSAEDM